jgi:DNA-binding CsgD family transcriptional regulator
LRLLINGQSPKEIARQLRIRPSTVRVHLLNARERTQTRSTLDLAVRTVSAEKG